MSRSYCIGLISDSLLGGPSLLLSSASAWDHTELLVFHSSTLSFSEHASPLLLEWPDIGYLAARLRLDGSATRFVTISGHRENVFSYLVWPEDTRFVSFLLDVDHYKASEPSPKVRHQAIHFCHYCGSHDNHPSSCRSRNHNH